MDSDLLVGIGVTALFGLAGIAATHIYHRRTSREQRAVVGKLPDLVSGILKQDVREKLTVEELNDLIYMRTADEDAWKQGDPLPYKACPRCGNTELLRGQFDGPRDHIYYGIECTNCKWSEVTE